LKLNDDYDYVLVINFLNKEDLTLYYNSKIHSLIRKKLYPQISEGVNILYKLMDKSYMSDADKAVCFEKIVEELISKYMTRQDYAEALDIDSILTERPYAFSYKVD